MNPLVKLYESMLADLAVVPDDRGLLSLKTQEGLSPCLCNRKRLVLPTQEVLRASLWNEWTGFHPLSENIVRGESPVITKLKILVSARLTLTLTEVLLSLMAVASDTNNHDKLTPDESQFLKLVPTVDKTTFENLDKILSQIEIQGEKRLVNVYIKRPARINGQNYTRGTMISFPILAELMRDDLDVYGVRVRKSDKAAILALMRFIYPDCDNVEAYSAGSSSMVAPYFDSLMRAFAKAAKPLRDLIRQFNNYIAPEMVQYFDMSLAWEVEMDNLPRYRDLIPVLEGNEGEVTVGTQGIPGAATTSPAVVAQVTAPPVQHQPSPLPVAAPPIQPFTTPQQPALPTAAAYMNPRAVVITDPEFKPLGGGTLDQNTGRVQPPGATSGDDWMNYTEKRMAMLTPAPAYPVFAAVGQTPAPAPYPQQMSMPGYAPQPGYAPPYPPTQPGYPIAPQYPAPMGAYPPAQMPGMPVFPRAN